MNTIHENTKITAYHSISQHVGLGTDFKFLQGLLPQNGLGSSHLQFARELLPSSRRTDHWSSPWPWAEPWHHNQPGVAMTMSSQVLQNCMLMLHMLANILAKSRGSQKLCLNQTCESAGLGTESSYFLGCLMLISMHCEVVWFQASWPRKAPKSVAKNMVVGGTVFCLRGFYQHNSLQWHRAMM